VMHAVPIADVLPRIRFGIKRSIVGLGMRRVSVSEAMTQFHRLLDDVERGETI
jgi:hypothetical protein